jgi:hypothetical protein
MSFENQPILSMDCSKIPVFKHLSLKQREHAISYVLYNESKSKTKYPPPTVKSVAEAKARLESQPSKPLT